MDTADPDDEDSVMRFIVKAAKDYPDECEATRKNIDKRLTAGVIICIS